MFVQQIPCGGTPVPTSTLTATGVSGLGARFRRRGFRGLGVGPRPIAPILPAIPMRLPAGPVRRGGSALSGCPCAAGLGDGLTFDGTGLFGTGLFSGGFDFSNWTIWEYATIGVGAYILLSVFHTTKHVATRTRKKYRAVMSA